MATVGSDQQQLAVGGGPLHRFERALRIERLPRLLPFNIAVTWVPLCIFAFAEWARRGSADCIIADWSVHVRLLVAMPVIVAAERMLEQIAGVCKARIFDEGLVPAASANEVRATLRAVAHWRDAALPETILLVGAFAAGVAALVGWIPAAGGLSGAGSYRYDSVRIWYGLVSLPVFQLFLWRSLYRFALWMRVLVKLASTPLALVATHGDRRGGISFLRMPSVVHGALFLFATSAVLCASWATQMTAHGTPMATFRSPFFVFVVCGVVAVLAPLFMFTPQLWRMRVVGLRRYGGLMTDYARRFQARWIESGDRGALLGTPDIQSLSDMTNAYQNGVSSVTTTRFGKRDAVVIATAALLPAAPLLFFQSPAHEVVKRVARLLLGGIP